jgi:hypothetical protein
MTAIALSTAKSIAILKFNQQDTAIALSQAKTIAISKATEIGVLKFNF